MADQQTISAYNELVEQYATLTATKVPTATLKGFMEKIGEGGFVLDLGCGPATDSAFMREAGLRVDPVDASLEMVKLANEKHNIGARQGLFNDIDSTDIYDGIWANFSLLHAPKIDFPRHISALQQALKPNGWLHIGMKLGNGEKRDKLARQYSYYTQPELQNHLTNNGLTIINTKLGQEQGLAGDIEPNIMILAQKTM